MPAFVNIGDVARLLPRADRISVVGVSGAGKSTLSRHLAASLNLRYLSLDRDTRWLPGWRVRARDEQRALHDSFVAKPRWVIDGTNISFMDTQLPRSDLMIWLRMPRSSALFGIAKRVASTYGRVRPDMAEGCPEKLPDTDFLKWIWTFEQRQAPRIVQMIDQFAPDLHVLVISTRANLRRLTGLLPKGRR